MLDNCELLFMLEDLENLLEFVLELYYRWSIIIDTEKRDNKICMKENFKAEERNFNRNKRFVEA